ncbi:MAG: DAK2 domain-containing protein [Oscillospiraceae bacterium]|nr:DAK2 domain-containing protein [Oscillospiraceae bacterium]
MKERINGALFKQMVLFGAACINLEKQSINDLNVFPVPDGDTGTNMSLTIGNAATELKKIFPVTVDEAARVTAGALLRGARGNSGVILSLLFRGVSKSLKGMDEASGIAIANALQEGVASAYNAVMKPAEGTVLTVSRLAAKRAVEAAMENDCAEYVIEEAIKTGEIALSNTIDQNPVLKKAGVVDAGGKGYLVILGGMLRAIRGEELPETSPDAMREEPAKESSPFDKFETKDIRFQYCTEFIVSRENKKDPDKLRQFLNSMGDSLVFVDDDEIIKVHVHTNHPGLVFEEALTYGAFVTTKVENMKLQHTEKLSEQSAQKTSDGAPAQDPADSERHIVPPEKKYGFLSVCAGDGLVNVFRDLGCDGVISGGQTMNPSTEDILREIDKTPAEIVFVLPNNKNIVMAAQQCQALCDNKKIIVIPSASIPQGIAAMLAVDAEADEKAIESAMHAAIEKVTTAQVTYAARDSEMDGLHIKEGDFLALCEHKLFGTDANVGVLLVSLAQMAKEKGAEFITLFYGEDVTEESAEKAEKLFTEVCPDAEVSLLSGGQPVYYYIISIE